VPIEIETGIVCGSLVVKPTIEDPGCLVSGLSDSVHLLTIINGYGIELIHPIWEGRSAWQI
jgi:hypothetical protein